MFQTKLVVTGVALCCVLAFAPQAQAVPTSVDLELSLLVDISGSVSGSNFDLQRDGYEAAFNNATIQTAIGNGLLGKIAVNLIYWSGASEQYVGVDWTLIDDGTSFPASDFADAVGLTTRPTPYNLTAPGSAINYAVPLFASNDYDGTRQVIDVSGDGARNDGADTSDARDAAVAAGIDALNGLAILAWDPNLDDWYAANIQAGSGSFTHAVSTFPDFTAAVDKKILREIQGVIPEPVTAICVVMAIGGLVRYSRKRFAA